MSSWEKSFLNNLLATPLMLVCVVALEDVGKMQSAFVSMNAIQARPFWKVLYIVPLYGECTRTLTCKNVFFFWQATCLALSCVMGLGISMSGIKCRCMRVCLSLSLYMACLCVYRHMRISGIKYRCV